MSRKNIRLSHRAGLAALAVMVVLSAASFGEPLDMTLMEEAQLYSLEYGVDHELASERLEVQQVIGDLERHLTARESRTFAGMWIEHSPTFKVVVSFTEPAAARLEVERFEGASDLRHLVEVRRARRSLAELEADRAAAAFVAAQLGVPVNTDINVRSNKVEILTTDAHRLEVAQLMAGIRLPQSVVVVEVEELAKPLYHIYGGLALGTCTSGFSVKSASGVNGILTAGHCGNSLSNSHAGSLQFKGEACGSGLDVQWHSGNLAFDPKIADGTSAGWRWITSAKSVSSQVIGEFVCKFGKTTGLTCGTISSKSFSPGLPCMNASGYVRVMNNGVQMGLEGDSGGPVFSGSAAYGTVSCRIGGDLCYAPINFISALGVQVKVYTGDPPPDGGGPCGGCPIKK